MQAAVIVVAAGQGQRMGNIVRKQYLSLAGMPILARAVSAFTNLEPIKLIIVVAPPGEVELVKKILRSHCSQSEYKVVEGGPRRQDSVFQGLQSLPPEIDLVCIHDGVRPLISERLVSAVLNGAEKYGAVIPVIPVTDTLKEINFDETVRATLPRQRVRLAQTPQAFQRDLIVEAYQKANLLGLEATDDSYLVEMLNVPVHILPGEPDNIKITGPCDLLAAEAYFKGER